jgi:hypothetical protein
MGKSIILTCERRTISLISTSLSYGGEIVLLTDVGENKVAVVGEDKYVKITDELWNFLVEVEKRKENIPPKSEKNPEPNLEDVELKSN